ncbi:MAG: hypothetical protein GWN18_15600, partial [Thermoplasmata archaeon]|nr:hypothetical protein [Thermoplasmata archaeon]NIS13490.1 hypothetical protein [Thermoplasmata archaeon]NIS21366.1 hypothetical protein [Thermoplasmata archaeon]NIT78907.1 hypothetical protein [Thermoplasmata archaeon]NIU50416.1 hypothetical protein [Thermoplasmata archaeon]
MVCTVMILVGLVVLLFLLFLPKVIEWRRGDEGSRRLVVVVMAVLMVSVGAYTAWLVMDYREWTGTRELEYTL